MFRRLFALVLLLALMLGGFYYWRVILHGQKPNNLNEIGQGVRDAATTASVRTSLALNRNLKPYAIEVSTQGGVVTLKGEVPSPDLKSAAGKVAEGVPNVVRVVNDLKANPALKAVETADRSIGERVDDEALEVQVKLALSLKRDLKGSDVSVKAYRKAVTLSGEVATQAQRETAVQTAREIPGVSGVTDDVRVQGAGYAKGRAAALKALSANPNLTGYSIQVREEGGRLILTGRVRTGAEKDLAGLIAQQAAGQPVENSLELKH